MGAHLNPIIIRRKSPATVRRPMSNVHVGLISPVLKGRKSVSQSEQKHSQVTFLAVTMLKSSQIFFTKCRTADGEFFMRI